MLYENLTLSQVMSMSWKLLTYFLRRINTPQTKLTQFETFICKFSLFALSIRDHYQIEDKLSFEDIAYNHTNNLTIVHASSAKVRNHLQRQR